MPASKFRFVSPGIQLREIDKSQIPDEPEAIGPLIIGRSMRGPALRPVKVQNFTEFVEIFGEPLPGGKGGDIWRTGGSGLSTTYGSYAAQAWLKNSTPLTFVRLLGRAHKDAESGGEAGWKIGSAQTGKTTEGGAYGLFLIDSGTVNGVKSSAATGTLAAIWYLESGYMALSGTNRNGSNEYPGAGTFILNSQGGPGFSAVLYNSSDAVLETFQFDFNPDSGQFARKVFNTNPTKLTSRLYSSTKSYFLGETFERSVQESISNSATGSVYGVIWALTNGSTDWNINQASTIPAQTNWIVAQDQGASGSFEPQNLTNLFQIIALDTGEWAQRNLKISITDIRYSSEPTNEFGTFTVLVRRAQDSDMAMQVVESFSNCDINPNSPNYIARRIGDSYAKWDDSTRRYRYYGRYANNSKYIYVKVASPVDLGGVDSTLIPFGYKGPLRFKSFTAVSGAAEPQISPLTASVVGGGQDYTSAMAQGASALAGTSSIATPSVFADCGTLLGGDAITASFAFPRTYLRNDTTQGSLSDPTDAFWGVDTTKSGSSTRFYQGYGDVVRGLPEDYILSTGPSTSPDTATEFEYIFTMDDVSRFQNSSINASSSTEAYYTSGSRKAGVSISAISSSTYKDTLDVGFDQFTVPMFGGFDGIDIKQTEPFNNYYSGTPTKYTSYKYNSIEMAIDACADPEELEFNIMSAPGVTTTGLTNHLMDVCERRADALAVIDIEGGYVPPADRSAVGNDYDAANRGSVNTVVTNMRNRQINNSYAATYYPWVQIRDEDTGLTFYGPPSIPALGTYSYSQARSELWFAPAGFTRGGLSEGAGGIPIVGVTERLIAKDRDKLYEQNINPIASFPAEGLVMFGQKTLQANRSALDRINVRRLLIHVKKEISRIAARLLFDQNVSATWDRFTGQAGPFLDSVKVRLGLMDYKIILDTTTTTPDLIDRNVMYAKIFLKPARAIEFIAIDFVITNSGASFED